MVENNIYGGINMFLPREVFYEKGVENYELGKELLDRYRKKGINCRS